jgi:hypothetical protein
LIDGEQPPLLSFFQELVEQIAKPVGFDGAQVGLDDTPQSIGVRPRDLQSQTSPQEGRGQVPFPVAGDDHEGKLVGRDPTALDRDFVGIGASPGADAAETARR